MLLHDACRIGNPFQASQVQAKQTEQATSLMKAYWRRAGSAVDETAIDSC